MVSFFLNEKTIRRIRSNLTLKVRIVLFSTIYSKRRKGQKYLYGHFHSYLVLFTTNLRCLQKNKSVHTTVFMSIGSESFHLLLFTITQRVRIEWIKSHVLRQRIAHNEIRPHKGPELPLIIWLKRYKYQEWKFIFCKIHGDFEPWGFPGSPFMVW